MPRGKSALPHRADAEMAAGLIRLVRALGRRLAEDDPPNGVPLLRALDRELDVAWERAVAGWRASGFTDREIGEALGVTKQAVVQRFRRAEAA